MPDQFVRENNITLKKHVFFIHIFLCTPSLPRLFLCTTPNTSRTALKKSTPVIKSIWRRGRGLWGKDNSLDTINLCGYLFCVTFYEENDYNKFAIPLTDLESFISGNSEPGTVLHGAAPPPLHFFAM